MSIYFLRHHNMKVFSIASKSEIQVLTPNTHNSKYLIEQNDILVSFRMSPELLFSKVLTFEPLLHSNLQIGDKRRSI